MIDNKMTDNEIIKALENFHHRIVKTNLYYHIFEGEIIAVANALDLINRKNAEIEKLNKEVDAFDVFYFCSYSGCEAASNKCWKTCPNSVYNKTRTEVIKEYREKAAIKLAQNARSDYWHWIDDTLYEVEKEMVGENNV